MADRPPVLQLIRSLAPRYRLDPRAVAAVARSEGGLGWGAVGDQGTSYGPFQLHEGGALPRGQGAAFANSPAGVEYALQRMAASGARGKQGQQAIEAIVRGFERPADPDSEIRRSLGYYGAAGGQSATPADYSSSAPASAVSTPRSDLGASLLSARRSGDPGARRSLLLGLLERRGQASSPAAAGPPSPAAAGSPPPQAGHGALAEAFYDPLGSYDNGHVGGPIGGHSDHVHLSITDPQQMVQAIELAKSLGLRVSENPYVDPVDPVHVKGSFHYRTAGKVNGRPVGEALDASGSPAAMARFYKLATRRFR